MTDDVLFTVGDAPRRVARVLVDSSLPHLDRYFDYAVPEALDSVCVPGSRVRMRFAGVAAEGYVVERVASSPLEQLEPITRVVSAEPVLQPQIVALTRAVADYYGGSAADVVRLAVPPRHATTEKTAPHEADSTAAPIPAHVPTVLDQYPTGTGFLEALRSGATPRAAWTCAAVTSPVGDWIGGFLDASAATLASGRRVLILVPDKHEIERVVAALEAAFGRSTIAVLTHDQGDAERYRAFLAAERGTAAIVIGTRAATYAPVANLGLIALWDDGDDQWSDPRAPYAHSREVVCLRASIDGCALLFGGVTRTPELQQLVEKGWLGSLSMTADERRGVSPVIRAVKAEAQRVPHEVFATVRAGLARGPVLVQIPRAGSRSGLLCTGCGERASCPQCGGTLREIVPGTLACRLCGCEAQTVQWLCPACQSGQLRAIVIGAHRQTDEFVRAFPGVKIVRSSGDHVLTALETTEPVIVVATPGAEPTAPAGYAAAVLLDAELLLSMPYMRAAEEAMRRWSLAVSRVQAPELGGTVTIVGEPTAQAIQALIRHDPDGFAARELAERKDALLAPATAMISIEGEEEALTMFSRALRVVDGVHSYGPLPLVPGGRIMRLLYTCPASRRREFVAQAKAVCSYWAENNVGYLVRIRVDPLAI